MKSGKITDKSLPPFKRRYDEACAATHAMDIIGERWAVPVMRELMLGPRRFSELRASINGISANVLTQRLGGLEVAGVIVRKTLPPPASVRVYELTRWGYEAAPIFQVMGRWAVKSPMHDPTRPFSATSLILSLRTMIDREAAAGLEGTLLLRLDGEDYFFSKRADEIDIGRGRPEQWRTAIAGAPSQLAAWVYSGDEGSMLAASEGLAIEGDLNFAMRFAASFDLPDKAPLPAPKETPAR